MAILYLEARKKFTKGEIDFSFLKKVPGKKISLAATIQYLPILSDVKKYLESIGKKVIIKNGPAYPGHIIGCNSSAFDKNADTLLLISDGKFHSLNNAIQLEKEIYIFSGHALDKISTEEVKKIIAKKVGKIKKFLSSDKIGVLVSIKHGQNFKAIQKIKKKIENLGKKVYVFEADNVNSSEFDNFSLPIYINTACYGLALDDSRILNLQDILSYI